MSKRTQIVSALVDLVNENLNGFDYDSNIHNNAHNKLVFWDEVNDYPYMSIIAGSETREYLPGGFKWGFLEVQVRIYIEDENPQEELESFIEDFEDLLDKNNNLEYDSETRDTTELISILSISTDQGLFAPIGVGEITIQIQYDL